MVAFALFVVAALAGIIVASILKGIWYEEMWSVFMGRHDAPAPVLYATRWAWDTPPPLFYFASWLFQPITGDTVVGRRLLNIVPIGLAGAVVFVIAARRAELRPTLVAASVLFLANPLLFDVAIQHRYYLGQTVAWFACCCALLAAATAPADHAGPRDRWLVLLLAATMWVAFNLHYLCALLSGVVVAVTIVQQWFAGRRRWAMVMAGAALVAGATLVVSWVIRSHQLAVLGTNFWVTTTPLQALAIAASALGFVLLATPAVWAAAYVASREIEAAVNAPVRRRARGFAVTMALGVAAALALALALNAARPLLIRQYLIPVLPPLTVAIAVLAAPGLRRRPALFYLLIANAVVDIGFSTWRRSHVQDADELARVIGGVVRRCPGTPVFGAPHWLADRVPTFLNPNEWNVVRAGYGDLGRGYHFNIQTVADGRRYRPPVGPCPVVLWAEHHGDTPPAPAAAAANTGLILPPGSIARAQVRRSGTGFIIVYPADEPR